MKLRKKVISVILILCMLTPVFTVFAGAVEIIGWNGDVSGGFASGDGTLSDPYIIETAEQFAYMAKMTRYGHSYEGKFFRLTRSLDLGNREWIPFGMFCGYFDGGGNTIYNWKITDYYINTGLFGRLHDATVKNLGISNFRIEIDIAYGNEGICAGGFAGVMDGESALNGCYATGIVSIKSDKSMVYAGILVGNMADSQIIECFTDGEITAVIKSPKYNRHLRAYTGGIAGLAYKSKIINSYTVASVEGTNAGMFVGWCVSEIWSCFYYSGKIYKDPFYSYNITGSGMTLIDDKNTKYLETFEGWDFENAWELLNRDDFPSPTLINTPLFNHTLKETYKEAPTCTEEGCADYKCMNCSKIIHVILPANGHTYGNWTTIKEPEAYSNGTKRRTCIDCKTDEYAVIPMLSAETTETEAPPETTKATMPTIFTSDTETTAATETTTSTTTSTKATTKATTVTTTETTTPVTTEKPIETTTSSVETTTEKEPDEEKSPLGTLITLIIIGSVLLVILGGILFIILKNKKD